MNEMKRWVSKIKEKKSVVEKRVFLVNVMFAGYLKGVSNVMKKL